MTCPDVFHGPRITFRGPYLHVEACCEMSKTELPPSTVDPLPGSLRLPADPVANARRTQV